MPAPFFLVRVGLEDFSAITALAHLLIITEDGMADARTPVTFGADYHHLPDAEGGFLFDDACLSSALTTTPCGA